MEPTAEPGSYSVDATNASSSFLSAMLTGNEQTRPGISFSHLIRSHTNPNLMTHFNEYLRPNTPETQYLWERLSEPSRTPTPITGSPHYHGTYSLRTLAPSFQTVFATENEESSISPTTQRIVASLQISAPRSLTSPTTMTMRTATTTKKSMTESMPP